MFYENQNFGVGYSFVKLKVTHLEEEVVALVSEVRVVFQ